MKCKHEHCHCQTQQVQTEPEGYCSTYCQTPKQGPEDHCACGHPVCVRSGEPKSPEPAASG